MVLLSEGGPGQWAVGAGRRRSLFRASGLADSHDLRRIFAQAFAVAPEMLSAPAELPPPAGCKRRQSRSPARPFRKCLGKVGSLFRSIQRSDEGWDAGPCSVDDMFTYTDSHIKKLMLDEGRRARPPRELTWAASWLREGGEESERGGRGFGKT